MKKKIIYTISGIIGLFVIIALIAPKPDQTTLKDFGPSGNVETNVDNDSVSALSQKKQPETAVTVIVPTTKSANDILVETKPAKQQYTYYSVTQVVDGDTIKISLGGKEVTLRLIGMDTPETVDPRKPVQCFGKEASNKAKELLSGKKVRIEMDQSQGELDKYGRTLAYVYRDDGLFYNKYMIEQGYAHEYTYNTPYKYQAEFKSAQKSAQTTQLGLWSPSTCGGDTTSQSASTPTTSQATGKYYTSSYYSSKYYYPENCDGWKTLSSQYLKSFDSLNLLLASYPSKILSPQCQ